MTNYEVILDKALCSNSKALKELEYYAGAGDEEAQFHLAYYYAVRKGDNSLYQYWLHKSAENGYKAAVEILKEEIEEKLRYKQELRSELSEKGLELGLRAFLKIVGI